MKQDIIKGWITRDDDDYLCFYTSKPIKEENAGCWYPSDTSITEIEICLDKKLFPEITWEDKEPTCVEITIKEL